MKMPVAVIVCAAGLVWTAIPAHAAPGDPIQGTPVGLEHDPSRDDIVVRGTTDREGNVTFNSLKPGRYVIVLEDTSKLKVPTRVTISGPAASAILSEPFAVGGTRAYAMNRDGRRIVVEIAKPNSQSGGAAKAILGMIKVRVETAR